MNCVGDVPQQVRAPYQIKYGKRRTTIDFGAIEILHLDVVEPEHCGVRREAVGADARDKVLRHLPIVCAITRGLHQVQPEDVVTERTQSQWKLKNPRQKATAERIAGYGTSSDNDQHRGNEFTFRGIRVTGAPALRAFLPG